MMTTPIGISILLRRPEKTPVLSQSMTLTPMMKVPTTVPTGSTTELSDHRQSVQKAACTLSSKLSVKCREPQLHLPAFKISQQVYAEYISINNKEKLVQCAVLGKRSTPVGDGIIAELIIQ